MSKREVERGSIITSSSNSGNDTANDRESEPASEGARREAREKKTRIDLRKLNQREVEALGKP